MPSATLDAPYGVANEHWGGFVFTDPSAPAEFTQTPPPSGPVPGEDGIPQGHPGLEQFSSVDEAVESFGGESGAFIPGFLPDGYELVQGWLIRLEDGRVVDFSFEYRASDSTAAPFSPDLWIGWTDRAPHPLPALTVENELPGGRQVGEPVRKLVVNGQRAVYQEWTNAPSLAPESRIASSLNWFEGGRLWFVQGFEPLDTLLEVAAAIRSES